MKPRHIKPFWIACFFIGLIHLQLHSQNKYVDSLYSAYFKLATANEKLTKAPALVLLLGNVKEAEKANKVIRDLDNLKVEGKNESLKKGTNLFCKALLYKTLDSLDKSMLYAKLSAPLLANHKHLLAEANGLIVVNYFMRGQFDSCILVGNKVLTSIRESKNINGELEVLTCVGRSYDFMGDRKKGIQFSLEAIEIAKQHHKNTKLSELYISLSTIYKGEDLQTAKKYGLLSLEVLGKENRPENYTVLNASYLILGNVYLDAGMLDSALYYYNLCKDASLRTHDQRSYMSALGNIGNVAYNQKQYNKALEYNFLTLEEYRKIGIKSELAIAYGSLADIYKDMKEYHKAIKYYDSALVITKQIQSADDYIYNYKGLSETYDMMGNYKDALTYYKLYRQWNDSINNNQNSKKITQMELDYRYKSEQREKDLIQKNKDSVTQAKIQSQKYIIWAGVLGALLLTVFLVFVVKSNLSRKRTNAQLQTFNEEILKQKDIIEEKNSEITDSITYASRIQQGVIPDDEEMKLLFPQHFVFFKPRDIVSGDFYWANCANRKTGGSNNVIVAVADCTGHGVPGAFMSLVGNTLLNQTLNVDTISSPAQALDYINQQLPKTIKSKSSTGAIKDGMEVAMCEFNFDTLTMQFAGANTNIYVVRDAVIQIYKGDKQPIGESHSGAIINYTNQTVALQKNDCVYLITDGYADQFGGEKGKKFKYKQLENLFCTMASKKVEEQREIISRAFETWKSHHEQVDDVLVMGIKL